MNYNISKELFKEITGNEGTIHEYNRECIANGDTEEYISINDFFFMCKEWALKQEICLLTGVEEYMPISYVFVCFQSNRYRPDPQSRLKNPLVEHKIQTPTMYGDNEKQCLFDACQWILDNKDKQ